MNKIRMNLNVKPPVQPWRMKRLACRRALKLVFFVMRLRVPKDGNIIVQLWICVPSYGFEAQTAMVVLSFDIVFSLP